ncbi:S-layer homology domain-containing protein [Thermotalea metallivorans]|uniref:S-layer protein sap n=1 Tax=Thermotalea metallivorans TaxID=520762 RepID=A0A140L0C4_9FIRM|nr:S-layer homology domain-containing protein [Thermotalea metallivorans]KXG73999.1 S-layer protein sap [Thermotalea metallivorans]
MKKTIPILLILILILFIVPVSANPMNLAKKFIDMGNHWAEVTVNKLIELGVIKGYEDNTFRPDNTITRAEFSTVIRKAFQLDLIDGNSFTDTNNHWAGKEIHTLVAKGIIDKSEYGTKYSPNEKITRIEMAKMIVRAMGLDAEAKEKANQATKFADDKSIKAKDKGYIIIASENKIINGYPDNTFQPNGKATRAEASTMITKMIEIMENGTVPPTQPPVVVPVKEYSEMTEFPSKNANEVKIKGPFNVYLENVDKYYFAKATDFPIKVGDFIITGFDYDKTPDFNGHYKFYIQGIPVKDTAGVYLRSGFIDTKDQYRFRSFMGFDEDLRDVIAKKFPDSDIIGFHGNSEITKDSKFTGTFYVDDILDWTFDGKDFSKIRMTNMKYIMLRHEDSKDVLMIENPFK